MQTSAVEAKGPLPLHLERRTRTTTSKGEKSLKAEKVYSTDQRHWTVNAGMAVGEVFG